MVLKTVTEIKKNRTPAIKKHKLRVAAYCRVSTDNDAQLDSLSAQRSHYEVLINSHQDWELVDVYFDEGITGTKIDKRLGLQKMVADCENHLIDLILTKSISRFSRNTADCLRLVRKLQALNIPLYFERENINTCRMENEVMLSSLSSMAENESHSIADNAKWAIQNRFKNGSYKIGYPPYGYDWIDGKLKTNYKQASIVKGIFASYLSGKGVLSIATDLNKAGIPTKRGASWNASTVKDILTNEKYTGDVIFQKTFTDDNFKRHVNAGQMDQYLVKNHHEAIISHEDFKAVTALLVQHRKEKNIVQGSDKYQNRYAFSGKIVCQECGNILRRRTHSSNGKKYIAWLCNTHLQNSKACSLLYIKNDALEDAFTVMLNKLICTKKHIIPPLIRALQAAEGTDSSLQRKELDAQLLLLSDQRQNLQRLMAQGYLDQAIYLQQKNELLAQTEACKKEIEAVQKVDTKGSAVLKFLHFINKSAVLQEFQPELFKLFVENILVYNRQEIGFKLKCGLTFRERI